MKRLLPLLLGLAVSVAQADSNSDYRAGSDFARQIQGQGTGSIQGFKPQESIPGYNANPDETKYYGGVTAGGDGGLKNDGTTEWATGETGKTITESFMNKPKDILSPDAPFIQTGRDVVNRADSIVGNTGQQCSAQQINRSEFTNYTCERDTMVEEYCTRTARITGDWKYTDEYREVTIPHSQFRFSMAETGVQCHGSGNRYSGKCIIVCIRRFFLPELSLYLHEFNVQCWPGKRAVGYFPPVRGDRFAGDTRAGPDRQWLYC